jgi:hypothetical protein
LGWRVPGAGGGAADLDGGAVRDFLSNFAEFCFYVIPILGAVALSGLVVAGLLRLGGLLYDNWGDLMCSNCRGDYENPDEGQEVELQLTDEEVTENRKMVAFMVTTTLACIVFWMWVGSKFFPWIERTFYGQ